MSMPTPIHMKLHDKLLKEAALRHLKPIGGVQKGRSRVWLVDCAWYVAVVEFQPSSWSKGAYLNVGAHFLWRPVNDIGFDFGHRKEGHAEFIDEMQFAQAADVLARRAAEEVGILRTKLTSPRNIHSMTPKNTGESWIDRYHRGVSHALAGHAENAVFIFQSLLGPIQDVAESKAKADEYHRLLALVSDIPAFEIEIVKLIERRRAAMKLPALTEPPWREC
jgi:hypothetical protein